MAPVTLDTRPLAVREASSALLALKNQGRPSSPTMPTSSTQLSEATTEVSSQTVPNCHLCEAPLLWGSCMDCDEEHTCQRGNGDCYPCQLLLLETRVCTQTAKDKAKGRMEALEDQRVLIQLEMDDLQSKYDATSGEYRKLIDLVYSNEKENIPPAQASHRRTLTSHFSSDSSDGASPSPQTPPSRRYGLPTPDSLESSQTDTAILDLLLPTPSPGGTPDPLVWLDRREESPTRTLWMQDRVTETQPSPGPAISEEMNLMELHSQDPASPQENLAGFSDTSCSRTLSPVQSGMSPNLLHLSSSLAASTSLGESAMLMAAIISIVSSTSSVRSNSKIPTDFVSEIAETDRRAKLKLSPGSFALGRCMEISYRFHALATKPGIMLPNMETSSSKHSIDHLLEDLSRLEMTSTRALSVLKLRNSFLTMLKDILLVTMSSTERISEKLGTTSMESTRPHLKRKTTRPWGYEYTGTNIQQSDSGSGGTSPIQSPSFKRRRLQASTRMQ